MAYTKRERERGSEMREEKKECTAAAAATTTRDRKWPEKRGRAPSILFCVRRAKEGSFAIQMDTGAAAGVHTQF